MSDNGLLGEQLRLLKLRAAQGKTLSQDEIGWLLQVADDLRLQGDLFCNQVENQVRQFRSKETALTETFPWEPAAPERCQAARDGECIHPKCPQARDGEPEKSGRHCPLDTEEDDDG